VNLNSFTTVAIPHFSQDVAESDALAATRHPMSPVAPAVDPNSASSPIISLPYRPVKLKELMRRPSEASVDRSDSGTAPVESRVHRPREVDTEKLRFNDAISNLTDAILERFPLAAPAILLFVGTDQNAQVDSTCTAVATQLASRNIGNVLLIDSSEVAALTHNQGLNGQLGMSDLVNGRTPWESLVTHGEAAGLDFLPRGSEAWTQWGGLERLLVAAAEMKQHYQFVCVSGGDATSDPAHAWSGLCDGSYLLVSLTGANDKVAESAVAELRNSGARLLGCIVTDADGQESVPYL